MHTYLQEMARLASSAAPTLQPPPPLPYCPCLTPGSVQQSLFLTSPLLPQPPSIPASTALCRLLLTAHFSFSRTQERGDSTLPFHCTPPPCPPLADNTTSSAGQSLLQSLTSQGYDYKVFIPPPEGGYATTNSSLAASSVSSFATFPVSATVPMPDSQTWLLQVWMDGGKCAGEERMEG